MTESQIREIVRHEVAMLIAEESFRRSLRGRLQRLAEWVGRLAQKREHGASQ